MNAFAVVWPVSGGSLVCLPQAASYELLPLTVGLLLLFSGTQLDICIAAGGASLLCDSSGIQRRGTASQHQHQQHLGVFRHVRTTASSCVQYVSTASFW
jgi:hypothetical protein